MKSSLENIKGITLVEFKSNEIALEEQLSEYKLESQFLLETYRNDNPLKDSFILTYDPSITSAGLETIKLNIENSVDNVAKYNINIDIMLEFKEKDIALFKLTRELKYHNYNFLDETTIKLNRLIPRSA